MSFYAKKTYNHGLIHRVLAVTEMENGITKFLIWDDFLGRWAWHPASEFVPLDEEEVKKIEKKRGK